MFRMARIAYVAKMAIYSLFRMAMSAKVRALYNFLFWRVEIEFLIHLFCYLANINNIPAGCQQLHGP